MAVPVPGPAPAPAAAPGAGCMDRGVSYTVSVCLEALRSWLTCQDSHQDSHHLGTNHKRIVQVFRATCGRVCERVLCRQSCCFPHPPPSCWLPECHVNVNASALCTFGVPQRACPALPHATSFSHTSCPSATAAAAGCGIVGSVLSRVSNSIELWVLCDTPTPAVSALGMSACADTLHFKLCCFFFLTAL